MKITICGSPSSGKTTGSLNLGDGLAKQGYKVLYLENDWMAPQSAVIFGLDEKNRSYWTGNPEKQNLLNYLIDEIKILEPTLIIVQGSWALGGQTPFITRLSQSLGTTATLLKGNKDKKYGLYKLNSFMCITTHHPSLYGRWIANWSNDSLWPMIDYLKETGYLPRAGKNLTAEYEKIVKPVVDSLIKGMPSNTVLRQK